MKVKELIKILKGLNQNTTIGVIDDSSALNIHTLRGNDKTGYCIEGGSYSDDIENFDWSIEKDIG